MKKAYPTYKETEIPWLPEMPSSWRQIKLKYLFNERVEKGYPDEPLLAATQTQGVIPKEMYETRTVTAQKDFHLLKLVRVGDFVISLRSFQGGIEYAHFQGIISPAYTILKPLQEVYGGYFRHLLKSKNFIDDLTTYVTGIREGQNINYSALRDALAPIPSLPEQRQIAAYLDLKCALIDTFIAKKKRLIELLREQKQAIINQAVTRGVDPDVPLKPSGVDWLGDIPAHWEVKKLKYAAVVQNGIAINERTQANGDIELPYLRVANVQDGYVDLSKMKTLKLDSSVMHRYLVEEGDLLMNEGGDFDKLGRGVVWGGQIEPCVHQNHVFVLKVDSKEDPHWINLLSRSEYGKLYFILSSKQTTNLASISSSKLKDFPLVVPPKKERERIKKFLRESESEIDVIINRLDGELTLIQEYKTTLIAEAVTGKIDVRDWQAEADIPEHLKTALS